MQLSSSKTIRAERAPSAIRQKRQAGFVTFWFFVWGPGFGNTSYLFTNPLDGVKRSTKSNEQNTKPRAAPSWSMLRRNFPVPKTLPVVIVYQSYSLHKRITDRRADELESTLLQIAAQSIGIRRRHRNGRAPLSLYRPPLNKTPNVFIKASKLVLNLDKTLRVFYC